FPAQFIPVFAGSSLTPKNAPTPHRHLVHWRPWRCRGDGHSGPAGTPKEANGLCGAGQRIAEFASLDLAAWDSFVIGGHEVRDSTLEVSIDRLHRDSRVFAGGLIAACRDELAAIDGRI